MMRKTNAISYTPPPLAPYLGSRAVRIVDMGSSDHHRSVRVACESSSSGGSAHLYNARCDGQASPCGGKDLHAAHGGSPCHPPAPPNATGGCHQQSGEKRQYGRLARCSPCSLPPVLHLARGVAGQPPVSEVPRFPYVGLHAALNWLLPSLQLPPHNLGTSSHCCRLLFSLLLSPNSLGTSSHCCRVSPYLLLGCRHSLPS